MNIFQGLRNLTWLTLAKNALWELPPKLFSRTPLQNLFLNGNKLEVLPTGILHSLKNLAYLDLHDNQLELVPNGIFEPLVNLNSIRLEQNPWRCDYGNSYLRCWIKHHPKTVMSKNINKPESVICHSPQHLAGNAMVNVTAEEMATRSKTCSIGSFFVVVTMILFHVPLQVTWAMQKLQLYQAAIWATALNYKTRTYTWNASLSNCLFLTCRKMCCLFQELCLEQELQAFNFSGF
ncbi:hypothetical protein chiPu_0007529 [Chiloscyllium punctatum]|uniref:LRRCT domain-containing protein n=1 Tax=Chiloscyllium punctatum TaxID=137246 RepID=A0A401SF85_CHIPU|nr:hypothetical protein [Chiloscyllium punctatum]